MVAPPARTAATAKALTPELFLRVQATTASGAASTISLAQVATPDQISIRVWAAFQPRSRLAAGPRAERMCAPGARTAPEPAAISTVAPASSNRQAASSTTAATIAARASKRIRPGPLDASASVVRSP